MHWNVPCQLCLVTTSIPDNNLISLMSLMQGTISPVIFSWVEKSLTHPIQRDIFLGKIWIWIFSGIDPCRWPNETTAASTLKSLTLCQPHTYVFVLFSTVSLCDASTTWACQDSKEFGEHQEGFFTACQVYCEYAVVMAWMGCWGCHKWRLFAEIRELWQPSFDFQILQV